MPLKFFTDTHISKQVAIQLRNRGVDVVRCEEVGLAEAKDLVLLEYAIQHERVMVSIDKHFPGWHKHWMETGKNHTGVFCIHRTLNNRNGIGRIVTELYDYYQLIEGDAGTLETDINNQIFYIK
jgi:predicted nuclease of predicted toxin-antitoxin system